MTTRYTILLVSVLSLGCQSIPSDPRGTNLHITVGKRVNLLNTDLVRKALYSQFADWKSVRYKMGGLSKKGIDCSGFVYVTYLTKLGIKVPRTTDLQATAGQEISQKNLKAGDLVFFKTKLFSKHVGIYLESRKFLHASTSKGVIISSLDDSYWSQKYWKSVRVKT